MKSIEYCGIWTVNNFTFACEFRVVYLSLSAIKRNPWNKVEKRAVEEHLGTFILSKKVPGKQDCEKCIKKSKPALTNRTWKDIKNYIHNKTYKRKLCE